MEKLTYDKKEAARTLNISVETIDRYRKMGKMPHRLIGNRVVFTNDDLKAFLELCKVPATTPLSNRECVEIKKATEKYENT